MIKQKTLLIITIITEVSLTTFNGIHTIFFLVFPITIFFILSIVKGKSRAVQNLLICNFKK